MKRYYYLLISAILLLPSISNSQITINELSATNQGTFTDDLGKYPDWIELYNGGASDVNLANYGLSDAGSNIRKWIFPPVTIKAGGYLLLLATDVTEINVNHWETVVAPSN